MTVADLDSRLDSYELTEWMVYEQMTGPLGRRRGDIQAATIAATIANANRGKGGRRFRMQDLLIPYGGSGRKSPEEILAAVRDINTRLGGVERGRDPDS
ncbi:Protein of unknown function [Streptomyces sp. DI166]|uniref:phage tail assembly protein T n=1 Tax=Streptomyces sp. DI166 TaxID=1839783 RepID=UPI0007F43890|nr:DUF4035 domain-containing protein [Streptomyces sp. DI166]SBT89371.1 Protein of unknown function [Streptomyces sp. DI166]